MPIIDQTIHIESDILVPGDNQMWQLLVVSINLLNAAVPLKELSLKRVGATDTWKYEFTGLDNRKWKQDINFADGIDNPPHQTFNTPGSDGFVEESELVYFRPLKTAMINMIRNFGLVELKWTGDIS